MFSYRSESDYLTKPEDDIEFLLQQQREFIQEIKSEAVKKYPASEQIKQVSAYFEREYGIEFGVDGFSEMLELFPVQAALIASQMGTEHEGRIYSELDYMIKSYLLGVSDSKRYFTPSARDTSKICSFMQCQAIELGYRLSK